MIRPVHLAGCVALLLAAASGAEAAQAQEKPLSDSISDIYSLFPDKVVARGKGFEIKQSQIDEMYLAFKSNRAAQGQAVPEDLRSSIEADILEKLIATRLFVNRATEADKAEARQIAEEFLALQLKQAPSEESFNRQLRSLGMSPEQFRSQIMEQAIVKTVIDREIKAKKVIDPSAIARFYEGNSKLFEEPEKVRAAHILISTQRSPGQPLPPEEKLRKRSLANDILARARAGEDFKKLVQEFSDDANSKSRGGEYTFARESGFPPAFTAAAFTLELNQVSDLVETPFGYHIIKVYEKIPAKRKPLDQVQDQIRETLLQAEVEKELPAYVEKLKKEAGVQILGPES